MNHAIRSTRALGAAVFVLVLACAQEPAREATRAAATLAPAQMHPPRFLSAEAQRPDGSVYSSGGQDPYGVVLGTAELFTTSWASAGAIAAPRYSHTATALPDGSILLAGGVSDGGVVPMTYRCALSGCSAAGPLANPRIGHTATLLADGRVLVAGGQSGSGATLASVEIWSPATNAWQLAPPLPLPRMAHVAVRLGDGRVLVAGGTQPSAFAFDPASGTWALAGGVPAPATNARAVVLADGRVLLAGGKPSGATTIPGTQAFVYDPAANAWAPTGPLGVARASHALVALPDGGAVAFGGNVSGLELASVERWSPQTGAWAALPPMSAARPAPSAFLLGGSVVLVVGRGTVMTTNPQPDPSGAELYDVGFPGCVPQTCPGLGFTCGAAQDGCGGKLDCGPCPTGLACLGNVCQPPPPPPPAGECAHSECVTGTPLAPTCSGCAATVCTQDAFCCNAGWDGACVNEATSMCGGLCAPPPSCVPTTCAAQGKSCGTIPDGCGGALSCGTCPSGQACTATNVCAPAPGACAHPECVVGVKLASACSTCAATVCAKDPYCCATAWDSVCVGEAGSMCGGLCGPGGCVPTSCAAQGKTCGTIPDGCGGAIACGACPSGQICSAANVCQVGACAHSECIAGIKLAAACSACANVVCTKDPYCCTTSWDSICVGEAGSMCGGTCGVGGGCTPTTCAALGKTCGTIPDGCGGTLSCGACPAGQACTATNVCAPASGACAHPECITGAPLAASCSSCAATVCASDSFCCASGWDSYCVTEAKGWCGLACP